MIRRNLFVRRLVILENQMKGLLVAKDLLDDSVKEIHLTGKQRMLSIKLKKGVEIYAIGAKTETEEKWRLLTQTDCKMNQDWYALKLAFKKEAKALGIEWTKDSF